ncbi:4Fe-4S dicluster domain-containing protein [Desulfobacula sp.]|uniref:4Fe-4S dicluster domain-containing protein n=1 Tax=Desulfobacula sp. TaxID=2593537 RepID=UPI00261649D4|nr:4Fe-4S dicluster domain-containing protein [Desulfobacula sp.]
MVIDLKSCIGCNSCVLACKAGNGTPKGIFWNKILERETGKYPTAIRQFWSMRCMQCENPACMEACPTGATYQREDGIVVIDAEKCVGCKACMLACPYDARSIWEERIPYFKEGETPYEKVVYKEHVVGVVQKCDFCSDRLDRQLEPRCVETCPTGTLIFGDLDDPMSDVSKALGHRRLAFRLHEELGTSPSIYYLGY